LQRKGKKREKHEGEEKSFPPFVLENIKWWIRQMLHYLGGTHALIPIFLLQSKQKGFPFDRCRNTHCILECLRIKNYLSLKPLFINISSK